MSPEREDGTVRRGPKLRGDKPRERLQISLDPDVTSRAKEHAAKEGESLSGLIERLLLAELGD
jgi:hypothetical protein